jgi:hypothetical protein
VTLIETASSGKVAIQVSDRLVSRGLTATRREKFDEYANKTIVFAASDAIVVMSYTGDAYIGGEPSDAFIARTLNGAPFPVGPLGRPGFCNRGTPTNWPSLESALKELCAQLGLGNAGGKPSTKLAIYGIGWRSEGHKGHQERVLFEVTRHDTGNGLYQLTWLPRTPRNRMDLKWSRPIGDEETQTLMVALQAARPNATLTGLLDGIEHSLVASIQRVASRDPTIIGADCMAVVIPPFGDVLIRYHPADLTAQDVREVPDPMGPNAPAEFKAMAASGKLKLPLWYSPWIVGPHLVYPPSNMSGPQFMDLSDNGRRFVLATTGAIGSGKFLYAGSADRPKRP